jgi:hypothetical protein
MEIGGGEVMSLRIEGSTATLVFVLLGALPSSANATDTGAVGNGNWSSVATWTNGVPGATDRAFIACYHPAGAAGTATVTLSQNTSANDIFIASGPGTSGTLDLGGFRLNADQIYFGTAAGDQASITRTNGGTLSVSGLISMNTGYFSFAAADITAELDLSNSTATTAAINNITRTVDIGNAAVLNLGADLQVGQLNLHGQLNANGHALSASTMYLGTNGYYYPLVNRGPITAGYLSVFPPVANGPPTFNLTAADSVVSLELDGVRTVLPAGVSVQQLALHSDGFFNFATATTSANGNVTKSVYVDSGCIFSLGADLTLADNPNLYQSLDLRGTLNANGHTVSANTLYMGYYAGPAAFQNDGLVNAGVWDQGHGTRVQLRQPGDTIHTIYLTESSALTVRDAAGQSTGLTLAGPLMSDLMIDAGSNLVLEVNGLAGGWVFRWADPNIADMQALINGGEITFTYLNGGSYNLTSDGTYTYVNVIAVPEPSTLFLSLAAAGLCAICRRQKP